MYHPIVKEQVNPGQLEGLQTNPDITERVAKCQALICCEKIDYLWISFALGTIAWSSAARK
jgi:hypothetical protein